MEKEDILLQKRLSELSKTAHHRGITTFSDFLNLNEFQLFHRMPEKMIYSPVFLHGGYSAAERRMAAFVPPEVIERLHLDEKQFYPAIEYNSDSNSDENINLIASILDFPISCLTLRPLQLKFAEKLTHRDYLGALLNLGIERNKTGDILVSEDQTHLFIDTGLSQFVCDNLTRVRHTNISVTISETTSFEYEPRFESLTGNVASIRLDSLVGLAFGLSRSKAALCIEDGKVFVNNRQIYSNGYKLREKDIISLRGSGRFSYRGISAETRKGRYFVELYKYI